MPYDKTKQLPDYVQKLPSAKRRQWMHVFNSCSKDGGSDSKCFAMANGVAKKDKSITFELPADAPCADEFEATMAEKSYQYVESYEYESRKLSQEQAAYNPVGGDNAQACSNCRFFVSPARCTVVSGEIAPNGLSNQWQAVTPYVPEPMPVIIVDNLASKEAKPNIVERVLAAFKGGLADSSGEGFGVVKQKDGRLRWYARYSNKWRDRDKEITAEAAHADYVNWVTKSQSYPELWVWHTKGTRFGVADWIDYSDGFAHASGLIDDTPGAAKIVKFLSSNKELGVSHGFVSLQRGDTIEAYRTYEISVLPRKRAAVWTTDFNLVSQGKETTMGFTAEKRTFLVEAFGEDTVARLEKDAQSTADNLKQLGIDFKAASLEEPPAAPPAAPTANSSVQPPPEATQPQVAVTSGLKELGVLLVDLNGSVKAMSDKIGALEADLTKLKASDDEKIANAFASKVASTAGASVVRPTENPSNVLPDARVKAATQDNDPNMFFLQQIMKDFAIEGAAATEASNTGLPGTVAVQGAPS